MCLHRQTDKYVQTSEKTQIQFVHNKRLKSKELQSSKSVLKFCYGKHT